MSEETLNLNQHDSHDDFDAQAAHMTGDELANEIQSQLPGFVAPASEVAQETRGYNLPAGFHEPTPVASPDSARSNTAPFEAVTDDGSADGRYTARHAKHAYEARHAAPKGDTLASLRDRTAGWIEKVATRVRGTETSQAELDSTQEAREIASSVGATALAQTEGIGAKARRNIKEFFASKRQTVQDLGELAGATRAYVEVHASQAKARTEERLRARWSQAKRIGQIAAVGAELAVVLPVVAGGAVAEMGIQKGKELGRAGKQKVDEAVDSAKVSYHVAQMNHLDNKAARQKRRADRLDEKMARIDEKATNAHRAARRSSRMAGQHFNQSVDLSRGRR